MSSIIFRLAEESDNEGIIDLARRCPQEGMITFYVNRTPRFNSIHREIDPEAWHFIACHDRLIIGLVGIIHFEVKILDKTFKVGYMLDLRLDKDYRSGTTAYRLVKTAINYLYATNINIVLANFVTRNKRSLVFTTGRSNIPKAHYLGRNRIFNLIPLCRMKTGNRFETGPLSEKDIPEVVSLYRYYSRNFKIAPVMTEERIKKFIRTIRGLSTDRFLVARENGKIRAITAFWDEHHYKSYQVLKLTPGINIVNGMIRFLSHFGRMPHPIVLNEPLRQLSLVLYAHDDCPEALEALFRHINNLHLGSEYSVIILYAQENDPLFTKLKNFRGVSVNSELYIFAKDISLYDLLRENPSPVLQDVCMTL